MKQSFSKGLKKQEKQVKHDLMRIIEQEQWKRGYLDGRTASEWAKWGSTLNWLYKST
jgi:hypothetical protein